MTGPDDDGTPFRYGSGGRPDGQGAPGGGAQDQGGAAYGAQQPQGGHAYGAQPQGGPGYGAQQPQGGNAYGAQPAPPQNPYGGQAPTSTPEKGRGFFLAAAIVGVIAMLGAVAAGIGFRGVVDGASGHEMRAIPPSGIEMEAGKEYGIWVQGDPVRSSDGGTELTNVSCTLLSPAPVTTPSSSYTLNDRRLVALYTPEESGIHRFSCDGRPLFAGPGKEAVTGLFGGVTAGILGVVAMFVCGIAAVILLIVGFVARNNSRPKEAPRQ